MAGSDDPVLLGNSRWRFRLRPTRAFNTMAWALAVQVAMSLPTQSMAATRVVAMIELIHRHAEYHVLTRLLRRHDSCQEFILILGREMVRKLLVLPAIFLTGCAATLPAGGPFSAAMLERGTNEEALLFVYSMPDNQKAYYKHILIDGVHQSTITNETFARLVVSPGEHTVRISQHGWKNRIDLPPILGALRNPEILALIDGERVFEVAPGGVHFLAIHTEMRPIYYECGESATATQVCSKEVNGVVIKVPPRETALSILSSLNEVCDESE